MQLTKIGQLPQLTSNIRKPVSTVTKERQKKFRNDYVNEKSQWRRNIPLIANERLIEFEEFTKKRLEETRSNFRKNVIKQKAIWTDQRQKEFEELQEIKKLPKLLLPGSENFPSTVYSLNSKIKMLLEPLKSCQEIGPPITEGDVHKDIQEEKIKITIPNKKVINFLNTFEEYRNLMKISEELATENSYNFNFSETIRSSQISPGNIIKQPIIIIRFLDDLLNDVKELYDSQPEDKKNIQSYLQNIKEIKNVDDIGYKEILYMFGIFITNKGICFDVVYNKDMCIYNTTLAYACKFQLSLKMINTFIKLFKCQPNESMFVYIPLYRNRKNLLEALKEDKHSLDQSNIINVILFSHTLDIFQDAIDLGAKPSFTTDKSQSTIINHIEDSLQTFSTHNEKQDFLSEINNCCTCARKSQKITKEQENNLLLLMVSIDNLKHKIGYDQHLRPNRSIMYRNASSR